MTPNASPIEPAEDPEPSRSSRSPSKPTPAEPETRAALGTRILIPLELAPDDESPTPETEPPLEPRPEPLPAPRSEPESPPLAEEPEPDPSPPRVDLRGRVSSPASKQLPRSSTPLVVFAFPDELPASERLSTTEAPPPAPVARRIEGGFVPEFIVTSPGRGICFENREEICHSFFSSSEPNAFDLGLLNPGESRTVDFQHPGPVQVYCSLHAGKQLSLFVAPSPLHALVEADGTFVLESLEPGDYYLKAWGNGLRSRRLPVRVNGEEMQPVLIHVDLEPEKGAE